MDTAWSSNIRVGRNMKEVKSVRITTIVDNDVRKEGLASSWGLSFYAEAFSDDKKHNVLMDTGGSFHTFFNNASKLGVDWNKRDQGSRRCPGDLS